MILFVECTISEIVVQFIEGTVSRLGCQLSLIFRELQMTLVVGI